MDTFIFNTFKESLLKGEVNAISDWRFICVSNKINNIRENDFRSIRNLTDLNLLMVYNEKLDLNPENKNNKWEDYIPLKSRNTLQYPDLGISQKFSVTNQSNATVETTICKEYLSEVLPVYFTYYIPKNTASADKPLYVDSHNFDRFIEKYPNNKHLKKLFLYPPYPTVALPGENIDDLRKTYVNLWGEELEKDNIEIDDPDLGKFFRYSTNIDDNETEDDRPVARGIYYVTTIEELRWCANKVNGNDGLVFNNRINIVLGDNIGTRIYGKDNEPMKDKLNRLKIINFSIGSDVSRPFEGILYGNGFKIQNVCIECTNINNGIIGNLGTDGNIDSLIVDGDIILKNGKKLSIEHMTHDGCDINAGIICGKNYGNIKHVYMSGNIYVKGFSPEVYTVSNRTDTKGSIAFEYPDVNTFYPTYLCINSKANIIPYIGYFAEGVHSTVMKHNRDEQPDSDIKPLAYWNAYINNPLDGERPYDNSCESEWAYPSGTTNSATDITAHVLYYDIAAMRETQSMLTEQETNWNLYMSMLPYSTYDYKKDEEEPEKFYWDVSATQYSDKSIKMHQFNRVSYNVGALVGCNHSNISNTRIGINVLLGGTFVGFMGGLAGKYAPHKYTDIIDCCINLSAKDDETRDYYDSLDINSTYEQIQLDNKMIISTDYTDSCDFYVDPVYNIDYPVSHAAMFLQLGLQDDNIESKFYSKNVTSGDVQNIQLKTLFKMDADSFETDFKSVTTAFENETPVKFSDITSGTIVLQVKDEYDTYDSVSKIVSDDRMNNIYRTTRKYNINKDNDENITLNNFSFTINTSRYFNKNKYSYKFCCTKNSMNRTYIYWFAGKFETILFNKINNNILKQESITCTYDSYKLSTASNVTLYGIEISEETHNSIFNTKISPIEASELSDKIFKNNENRTFYKCVINKTWKNDISDKDHRNFPFIGLGYSDNYYGYSTINADLGKNNMFSVVTTAKKRIGCKNYHIEKKSIKNIGALFGTWIIGGNSYLSGVSGYLYNQNRYLFDNTNDWWRWPYKLSDYAFNNRFSSLAAICEYNTDCIGDILPEKQFLLSPVDRSSKPVTFVDVHLRYNEPESQTSDTAMKVSKYPKCIMDNIYEIDETSGTYSYPFGVVNKFIAEIKPTYLSVPTIIESPLSNFKDFDMEASAITDSQLYRRIGLFTQDQNLASPNNDSIFWSINAVTDAPGDYLDMIYNHDSDYISRLPISAKDNSTSLIDLIFDGINNIQMGNEQESIWTFYPKKYDECIDVSAEVFSGNKKPASDIYFGSDINLVRYPASESAYGPYGPSYSDMAQKTNIIPYDTIIYESLGEFSNYFGKIQSSATITPETNEEFGLSLDELFSAAPEGFKENINESESDTYAEKFKYTYNIKDGNSTFNEFIINDIRLHDFSDINSDGTVEPGKFGFSFNDYAHYPVKPGKNEYPVYYNDDYVYDGSVFHIGMHVNEQCILYNLNRHDKFIVPSIYSDDLGGLIAIDNNSNLPIMYIDLSKYTFNGQNSYSINCSVNKNNLTSAISANYIINDGISHPESGNCGILLEIE